MRKAMKWRYYCDHCKKAGGHSWHMERHEKGCTANPNRECGVCALVELDAEPLDGLKTHLLGVRDAEGCITKEQLAAFSKLADGCPSCMLAALRQTKTLSMEFDFKLEQKSIFDTWREDHDPRNYM